MTMWAERTGQDITLHANCNIELRIDGARYVDVQITENFNHLRSLWHTLGMLIEQAEAELKEEVVEAEFGQDVSVELPTVEIGFNQTLVGESGPESVGIRYEEE